jgi:ABC-type glycerol-3-phosphate transport system permease component
MGHRRRQLGGLLDVLVLVVLALVSLYPIAWLAAVSLQAPDAAYQVPTKLIFVPDFVNYERLLGSPEFREALLNSILVAAPATILCVVAGSMVGFALSRYVFRGRGAVTGTLIVTRLFPAFAVVIPTFLIYNALDLLDTIPGLILAMAAFHLPIAALVMYRIIDTIPRSLDEAAVVDGASPLQVLGWVLAPIAAPGLAASAVLTFTLVWNEFLFILILAGNRILTLPVVIATFETQRQILWGPIAAASVLAVLPVVVVVLFAQRQLLAGLGLGAVRE